MTWQEKLLFGVLGFQGMIFIAWVVMLRKEVADERTEKANNKKKQH